LPHEDADMLAGELPNPRLVHADSIIELRTRPARLTGEIARFLAECWSPVVASSASLGTGR
jgi:hypothetical protein